MKSFTKLYLIFFSIIYCLSSCVTSKDTDLLQNIKIKHPEVIINPGEYRIIPGDQLSITVYAWEPKTAGLFSSYAPQFLIEGLSEGTSVSVGSQIRNIEGLRAVKPINVYADGTITFPYIGKVYVQDMTIKEIRDILSNKLDEFSPGTVADVSLANRYFSILGEAGAQRVTMTNTSMTIYQALAIANTIGPYGDRSKVSIIRQTQDGSNLKTFDIRSKDIIDTEYYYVQPNDVIYIPQKKSRFLGTTTSFTGVFGLITSIASVIVFTLRVF